MKKILILLSALLLSAQAQAALVSVLGQGKIVAPISVQEDGVLSIYKKEYVQFGFDEKQGVLVTTDIYLDDGTNLNGKRVDSHLIFLNTHKKDKNGYDTVAGWTFSGDIIGVMSDAPGSLMAASDGIFAAFNDYFDDEGGSGFKNQGLETGKKKFDKYGFSGTDLKLFMHVKEPGDWIRVVTVSAVPVPAALFLFAPALLGFLGLRRKTKTAIA